MCVLCTTASPYSLEFMADRFFQPVLQTLSDRLQDSRTKSLTENFPRHPLNAMDRVAQRDVCNPQKEREKEYDDDRNDRCIDDFSTRRPRDLLHFLHNLAQELADVRNPTEWLRNQLWPVLFFRHRRGSFTRARCCHCNYLYCRLSELNFSDACVKQGKPALKSSRGIRIRTRTSGFG